jgi:hypothetical protein
MYYRNPIKILRTTRFNNGIFRVYWFSVVTLTRLHRSDFIFQFYIYGGIFDEQPEYLLFARGIVFGASCAGGSFEMK